MSDRPLTTDDRVGGAALVLESEAGEALVFVAIAAAIARAGDDVIAVDRAPPWLDVACGVVRLRSRRASRDALFEAIGEHTRVLVALEPDDELLEALVELGPAVVAINASPTVALAGWPRACVLERTASGTRTHLGAELGPAVERTLHTLLGRAGTLEP